MSDEPAARGKRKMRSHQSTTCNSPDIYHVRNFLAIAYFLLFAIWEWNLLGPQHLQTHVSMLPRHRIDNRCMCGAVSCFSKAVVEKGSRPSVMRCYANVHVCTVRTHILRTCLMLHAHMHRFRLLMLDTP